MTTEALTTLLAREIEARRHQRYYLSGFLLAIAIILVSLVVL